jgi:septal ring factor EnvC (AmiA/AmiB activator)
LQSFASVSHKQEAADRVDALKAESIRRTEELRVAKIAADKRAKDKAEEAEKVRAARIAEDKRAKEKAERERLEKQEFDKLVAASSPGCVRGNCVSGFGMRKYSDGDRYEGNWKDGLRAGQGTYYWKDGSQEKQNWRDGKNIW